MSQTEPHIRRSDTGDHQANSTAAISRLDAALANMAPGTTAWQLVWDARELLRSDAHRGAVHALERIAAWDVRDPGARSFTDAPTAYDAKLIASDALDDLRGRQA